MTDRYLALELVRVTEAAALAASHWVGRGDKMAADKAAVDDMRRALNRLPISGTVVIGEGEQDEAPMLYIGEKVGAGGVAVDIAVDPLDGTTLTSKGGPNALAVIAVAEPGKFLHAPDMRMEKIAVGPGIPAGTVSLRKSPEDNILALAKFRGVEPNALTICLLDRERHKDIVDAARKHGARVRMMPDCDIGPCLATCYPDSGIDMYMGSGGAPEGVLTAAALRCLGGYMEGRLQFEDDAQRQRAKGMGIADPDRIYGLEDMAAGDVMFAATGVTDGDLLRGVRYGADGVHTYSIVMRSNTGTVRRIEARHDPKRKPL